MGLITNRSLKYPVGIVEDVLVKVDKFTFPIEFVILDIEEDAEVTLILGRPFLATSCAIIDMSNGKLLLRVGDDEVTFHINPSMRNSLSNDDSCFNLETSFDDCFSCYDFLSSTFEDPEIATMFCVKEIARSLSFEPFNLKDFKIKTFYEESPSLELKQLPDHHKYVFLEKNSKLPVIISSALSDSEIFQLVHVLNCYTPIKGSGYV